MTTNLDIANRALIDVGVPKKLTSLTQDSTEAAVINSIILPLRDETLRMAPWNCATAFVSLNYITSTPGTPENTSMGTPLWSPNQPPPPWAYMYQYPPDCLRPLYVVPQFQSGFTGGVPITTATTGGSAAFWQGPPVKFKVATGQFYPVSTVAVAGGGTGHAVGDIVTLAGGPTISPPIGGPVQLLVTGVAAGVITTVSIYHQGSYFTAQTNPQLQGATTGSGIGSSFNLTYGTKGTQRVILTNQEFALLSYIKQVTDPDVMDPLFLDAWSTVLSSRIAMTLIGDKGLANSKINEANLRIVEARKADGNEGLTVNDVTPDWIRVRGISYSDYSYTPNVDFNWGQLWTPF